MDHRIKILFLTGLLLSVAAEAIPYDHPMAVSEKGMVVTCQPLAAEAGVQTLRKGGNAADAFIATTLAEYVTARGYTSLSGPLSLLYYDAKSAQSAYLNAGLNKVSDPAAQFDPKHPIAGRSFVIGGAGRGLESLFQRFGSGKIFFKNLAAPAIGLARFGFQLSPQFARHLALRAPLFKNSSEWNSIFRREGKLLVAGDLLVQLKLAETLEHYGDNGANYLFRGKFAEDLVATIRQNGGNLTLADLAQYQVHWSAPLQTTYRDFVVQSTSFRSIGGLQLLLSLKTIENFRNVGRQPHFSKDLSTFEKVLRTYLFSLRAAASHWYPFDRKLDETFAMEAILSGTSHQDESPAQLWEQVRDPKTPVPWTQGQGTHSCNTIVIDREGNIATGLHTINALAWGDFGLMTDGVSLNSAYPVALDAPLGERAIDSMTEVLVFKDGKPWAAAGFFAGGLRAAAFEVMLNLMDYEMSPKDAIWTPRFGSPSRFNPLTIPLDARYPSAWVDTFAHQGIALDQPKTSTGAVDPAGYVDTGDAMVIRIDPVTGLRYGSPTEMVTEAIAMHE